jgi:hypothetical protein
VKPEDAKKLEQECTEVARRNWDGYVRVSYADGANQGVLLFQLFNEDDEQEGVLEAKPVVVFETGTRDVYEIRQEGAEESDVQLMQLEPKAIVGLLGL